MPDNTQIIAEKVCEAAARQLGATVLLSQAATERSDVGVETKIRVELVVIIMPEAKS